MKIALLVFNGFLLGMNSLAALALYKSGQTYTFSVVMMMVNVGCLYILSHQRNESKK